MAKVAQARPQQHLYVRAVRILLYAAVVFLVSACDQPSRTVTATITPSHTQAPLSQVNPPRNAARMTYDGSLGEIILFSGVTTAGTSVNDTWGWAGQSWRQIRTANAPPAQNVASVMAYDSTHSQAVLVVYTFVAPNNSVAQTWTFDGTDWFRRSPHTSPAALDVLLADSPPGGGVLAFGGILGYSNDGKTPVYSTATWQWDGQQWQLLHPPTSPAAEDAQWGQMTTDAATGQTILINQQSGAVWTWDGTTWTVHRPLVKPPSRSDAAVIFDREGHSALLLAGTSRSTGQSLADMWAWNGTAWKEVPATSMPHGIAARTVVYDAHTHMVVAYVVEQGPPAQSETWVWDGQMWQALT